MDQGWIATFGLHQEMGVQISFASQGGSGRPTPNLSIEVDKVDIALDRFRPLHSNKGLKCGDFETKVFFLLYYKAIEVGRSCFFLPL